MSLGDLVISLSADTARFQSDLGKASNSVDRWANTVVRSAKQAEDMIAKMSDAGITSIDRLQREFNSLGVATSKSIEGAAFSSIAAFVKIQNSGVDAFGEIARAEAAARAKLAQLPGVMDASGASVGRLGASFTKMGNDAIARLEEMREAAHRDFVAIQMAGELSASGVSAAYTKFEGAAQSVKTLRNELQLVNEQMAKMIAEGSLANSFKGLGVRSNSEISTERQGAVDNYNNVKNSSADPKEIERAHEAMTATLQRLDNETLTLRERNSIAAINLAHEEALAYQKSYIEMYDKAVWMNNSILSLSEKAVAEKINLAHEAALSEIKIAEDAFNMNQRFNYEKIQSQIKMYEEAVAIDRKLTYEKEQAAIKMYEVAVAMDQKLAYEKQQTALKMYDEAVIMDQKLAYEKQQVNLKMYNEAVAMDQKRTFQMEQEAAKRASIAAEEVAKANAYATKNPGAHIDRLSGAYDTLGLKSSLNIEAEKAKVTAAFEQIRNSGVASMEEIANAETAMKAKLAAIGGEATAVATKLKEVAEAGNGNALQGHTNGISGFNLASVAAIAKVQIMYSLINQLMSAVGSMPTTAVDAIENYKSSIITNAALITSMQGGVKDVGRAYQENKIYAEALEKVLIKMDTQTAASYKQLQAMNRTFVEQGVILDINNKKAIEGYTSIAQAVAVIARTSPNPDMQYVQEIKGLMSGTLKPGNELLGMLVGIDKDIVEKIKRWKEAGTIPENIGPMLIGFAAAKGDIEALWETTKSTMATIRDEILRGGLSEGFAEIVKQMKEVSKYAEENKEKIQLMIKDGFADAKTAAGLIWDLRGAFLALGETALYAGALVGIGSVILKVQDLYKAIAAGNALTGGGLIARIITNPVAAVGALVVGTSVLAGKDMYDRSKSEKQASAIGAAVGLPAGDLMPGHIAEIQKKFGGISDKEIIEKFRKNQIALETVLDSNSEYAGQQVIFNEQVVAAVKTPKISPNKNTGASKENSTGTENSYAAYSKAYDERVAAEAIIANRRLSEINEQGYAEGSISLKTYLSERERLIEASLNKEVEAKTSELITAQNKQAAAYANRIGTTDKTGKFKENFAAEINAQNNADKAEEDAQKALAVAIDKVNEAKAKGIKFDKEATDKIENWVKQHEIAASKVEKNYMDAAMEAAAKMQASVEYTHASPEQKARVDNSAIDQVSAAIYKDKIHAALELRNMDQEKIQDQLLLLDGQEKLDKLSGADALAQRIPLERQLALIQKDYVDSLDKQKDSAGWMAANKQYMQDMLKLNVDLKKQFDASPMGGFVSAMKSYADQANNLGAHVQSLTTTMFKGMEDALTNFVTKGKFNFKSFADSIISDMIRIVIQQQVTGPLAASVGSALGSIFGAGASNGTNYTFGSSASLGSGTNFQASSAMPSYTLGAPKISGAFADGGTAMSGKTYLVGEKGPELFTPGATGVVSPNSSLGGAPNVNINIQNNSDSQVSSKQTQPTFDGKQWIIGVILENVNNGGVLRTALGAH